MDRSNRCLITAAVAGVVFIGVGAAAFWGVPVGTVVGAVGGRTGWVTTASRSPVHAAREVERWMP